MNKKFYEYFKHSSKLPFFYRCNESFSYLYFKNLIDKKEKALKESGVKKNDLVGIRDKDPIEFFSTLFALWKIKTTVVPFSEKMPEKNILGWLEELQVNFLIENTKRFEKDKVEPILCRRLNEQKSQYIEGSGIIILTSGSSGKPKGVLLKEDNLFYSALGTNQFYNFKSQDRWGLTLPHHHIAGLMIPLRCLLAGGSVTLNDSNQSLPLFIREKRPTYLSLVPHQLKEVLNFISTNEDEDEENIFPSLKTVLVGGAFLGLQLKKQARDKKIPLSPTFGLSEMASQVTAQHPQDFLNETPSDHIGSLLPYREMVIDENHRILLGGKTIFSGYITKKQFQPLSSKEGEPKLWQSQDLGRLDEFSKLFLTGRQDKVFISGGENINPFEIETVLIEHEKIESAIAISIPHFKFGEVPFVFYQSEKELSDLELDSYCRNKLHPFKVPHGFSSIKNVSFSTLKPSKDQLSLIARKEIIKKNIFFKTFGDPKKPLVIFIHGFMGNHDDWDYFAQALANKYYCVSLDLPGHGNSPLSSQSFEELSFNLKNVIQSLNKSKCFLIGYSLGGRVALDLFSRYPDLISGIILESCHPGLKSEKEKMLRIKSDEKLFSNISNQNKEDFFKFLNKWYELPLFGNISKQKKFTELLKRRMKNDPKKLKSVMSFFGLGNQGYFFPKIYKSKTPILYISGDQDKKYTKIGQLLQKDSQFLNHSIIEDASHNTHFEKPLQFENLVMNFLNQLNS